MSRNRINTDCDCGLEYQESRLVCRVLRRMELGAAVHARRFIGLDLSGLQS
jgi:hypothetical protein